MPAPLSHRRPAPFDRFWFGAPYYPEHWNAAEREADPPLMADAGINVVRMAEFAWDMLEPAEGRFEFGFFEEAITRLGRHGISTFLCTPTAAPPRWLTEKYPDTLRVNADDTPLQHGSRQQCCHQSERFREYSRRITRAMAERFAGHPHVAGWQTDNEFLCHFSECHCPNCQQAFREFLRERHRTIEQLNRAWGTAFWAQTYRRFEEVLTPRPQKPTWTNPAQHLDYCRFLSWGVTRFQHDQVEILRRVNPKWLIFHNGLFGHLDYRGPFTRDLDVLGYDHYPFFEDPDHRSRSQAFSLDRARGWSGNFIVPEQQSGPGGQGNYFHDHPEPGEVRRMAWTSIARGADSLLLFRWRTCRFGAEIYWCGILDHDNVPRRRYEEVKRLGGELKRIGGELLGTSVHVDLAVAQCDQEVFDAHSVLSLGLAGPGQVAERIHGAAFEAGYAVGCIHPTDDLRGVKCYVVPHWALFHPDWVDPLRAYVAAGGVLVVGARTATHDWNYNHIAEPSPGVLRELCGVTVTEYGRQNRPDRRTLELEWDGQRVATEAWYEVLEPAPGSEVLARWTSRHLAGQPAITCRTEGAGRVLYVGAYLGDALVARLLPLWARMSGLQPLWPGVPSGVSVVRREKPGVRYWFFINSTDREQRIANVPAGTELVTGAFAGADWMLSPHDVAIIRAHV